MKESIDWSSVVPLSEMRGDSEEDTELLKRLAVEANTFIRAFDWCKGIKDSYFGFGIGGVIGVFFSHIIPANENVDEYLWIVVGDLPPAYLVTDENRTPSDALRAYISEMQKWADAAEEGQPVEELIPVNGPVNPDMAIKLKKRLAFLESEILPSMK